jgi:lipoprotein-releasing system permease protein
VLIDSDEKLTITLNLSHFISKRISRETKGGFSTTIHTIAIVSIGIGLGAAIVAFLIMFGFQETVKDKVYNFNGHLLVTRFTMSNSTEEQPMNFHVDVYDRPEAYPYLRQVQEFAHKPGLVKADDEVLGVVVKGVGRKFDLNTFRESMVEGEFIQFPDSGYAQQVVISKTIAQKIKAKVGDDLVIVFFQNPPRFRKLKIVGLYETNLAEYYDSKVIIGDIRMIQKLNQWSDSLAGGLEIFVKDPARIDDAGYDLGAKMDFDLNIESVSDRYRTVFEWLQLLSRQVNILLGIILIVVCVNMVSIVLLLVMERTQMIGMLKALGAGNNLIRSIFIYQGVNLILKGLVIGNALGLGVCWLQDTFKIIKLNPHDYYMSFVPISWHWEVVGLLNLLTFGVVTMVLLLPTMFITGVDPIKAIRFD